MNESEQKNNDDLLQLEGVIDGVTYHNEENGYSVCDLAMDDNTLATVVGIMPFVAVGETIRAMGRWETHAQYGRQFKIEYFEKQMPETVGSILKYLSSRAVRGIGPASAQKIVDTFGTETFDVLENHPDILATIPGISLKKAKEISENFKMQFGIRSVMMFCRDFFGPATAVRVYKRWGGSAIDVIRENPYALCDEIYGIGFERADKIARSLNVEQDAASRVEAGVKFFLSYNASNNGHVCLPQQKLAPAAAQLLGVSEEKVESAIAALLTRRQLIADTHGNRNYLYLKKYYEAEEYTAVKLDLIDRMCETLSDENVGRYIQMIELEDGISYAALQKKAIRYAVMHGVMVLTGGPGTGKTTVIKAVLRIFDSMRMDVSLAAPTGRAAKRMSEATQREAKTIHRLLEMEYSEDNEPKFHRDETNQLDEDVIIIDEASMVDILLMQSLLKAIKPGAHLILIGDADQLPSVGAGNVLNDIIACNRFNTVALTEIFRQSGASLIITNAHLINSGELPELYSKSSDFFFIRRTDDTEVARTIVDLCLYRLPKTYGEQIQSNIQIISPSRKGNAGTLVLNRMLQQALNPPQRGKSEKKVRDLIFRVGDKVMQVKNNYDISWTRGDTEGIGVFNGDIGIIREIDAYNETMTILFDERETVYEFSMLDNLEHAYAVTVHKSQGSEYPVVIIPMYGFSPRLMTRNLLYTAVTRAQEMVILVGREEIVANMVNNNRLALRYSGLVDRLKNCDTQ